MTTPPSCAPGNVHILSEHNRPSLETDLVLCDVTSWVWTCFPWIWIYWVLKRDMTVKMVLLKSWVTVDKQLPMSETCHKMEIEAFMNETYMQK